MNRAGRVGCSDLGGRLIIQSFGSSSARNIQQNSTDKHQGCGQNNSMLTVPIFVNNTLNGIANLISRKRLSGGIFLKMLNADITQQRANRTSAPGSQPEKSHQQQNVSD